MIRVHYLDDDELQREKVRIQLEGSSSASFSVRTLESADEIDEAIDAAMIFLVDLHLTPGAEGEGIAVIKKLQGRRKKQLVVAYSNDLKSIEAALAAGADDFIHKSSSGDLLALRLLASYRLRYPEYNIDSGADQKFVGATMKNVARRVPSILKSAVRCVHVIGETGTGKEVVADCFAHFLRPKQLSRVNCGAISPQLLESELFGHIKGSFTGAFQDKIGYLEQASGGWIFLDELATLSSHAQVALLRVIENQELIRVGDQRPRRIDLKVLSASNIPIDRLVEQGRFRNDLWQRLRESEITLPALSDRKDEISDLIEHFCRIEEGGPYTMTPEGMEILKHQSWSNGNIRALRNCIRAMTERHVDFQLTPFGIPDWARKRSPDQAMPANGPIICLPLEAKTFEAMSDHGLVALIHWHRSQDSSLSQRGLATLLGLPKSTLTSKLKKIVDRGILSAAELEAITK